MTTWIAYSHQDVWRLSSPEGITSDYVDTAARPSRAEPGQLVCWVTAQSAGEAMRKANALFDKYRAEKRRRLGATMADMIADMVPSVREPD